jgi:hypothetical protein
MEDKFERLWKEAVISCSKSYYGIFLAGLRKTMKNFRYQNTVWDYELKDAENGRNSKEGTLLYVCTFFHV